MSIEYLICILHIITFYVSISMHILVTRENLQSELDRLKDEQRYMEKDLSSIQMRWHTVREEKTKATNILQGVKRLEEELERLTEEKTQVDLFLTLFSKCRLIVLMHKTHISFNMKASASMRNLTNSIFCQYFNVMKFPLPHA